MTRTFIPWPTVFWACETQEEPKLDGSPFDRESLGYDKHFTSNEVFYHIPPHGEKFAREILDVPVMDLDQTSWVQTGTVTVVLLGTFWILLKLFLGVRQGPTGQSESKKTKTT